MGMHYHADHASHTAPVKDGIVEREVLPVNGSVGRFGAGLEDHALIEDDVATHEVIESHLEVAGSHRGEEAEMTKVDSENRHTVRSDEAGTTEERAVTTERDEQVEIAESVGGESGRTVIRRSELVFEGELDSIGLCEAKQALQERRQSCVPTVADDADSTRWRRHLSGSVQAVSRNAGDLFFPTSFSARSDIDSAVSPSSASSSPRSP
jgi:hypothetical protein